MALVHRIVARHLQQAALNKTALRQRALLKMMSFGGTFGVISAYSNASKSENKVRHGELIADLQRAGYPRVIPLKGSWEGVTERSVLVPKIAPGLLFDLGRKYEQVAVVYKSKDGVVGMYYTKGAPRAEVAVDPQGEPAFQMAEDAGLYSKARGLSFEFGVLWGKSLRWDGTRPIARKQLRQFVQQELGAQSGPVS